MEGREAPRHQVLGHPRVGRSDLWMLGGRCSVGALTTFLPQSTHNSVRRWCAPDEAFDLALLAMEGMLGLRAGDDGGSCWEDDIVLEMQEGQSPSWHPRLMGSEVYSPIQASSKHLQKACACKVEYKVEGLMIN